MELAPPSPPFSAPSIIPAAIQNGQASGANLAINQNPVAGPVNAIDNGEENDDDEGLFVEQDPDVDQDQDLDEVASVVGGDGDAEEEVLLPEQELVVLKDELNATQEDLRRARLELDAKDDIIAALHRQIENLTKERYKHSSRTWAEEARQALAEGHSLRDDPVLWDTVYKLSCKEENMSTSLNLVHPEIRFVERRDHLARCRDPYSFNRPKDLRLSDPENPDAPFRPFKFMDLPLEIQARIFKLWLHKDGRLVHCFSRLDFFDPPADFPTAEELGPKRSGLNTGFYWGAGRRCSLAQDLQDPNDALRVLLVNKHFNFIGAHCFYGLNTFAFSSLGEFFRFCQGIGRARAERIQNIEITFVGNQYLTAPRERRRNADLLPEAMQLKDQPPYSHRTHALSWLQEMRCLRTLVVHINEQGKTHMRRKFESKDAIKYMAAKTNGQPNRRIFRALRMVQGMDNIYQLRGMTWVRFYDLDQAMRSNDGRRFRVKDWSFEEDIQNGCTMEKVPVRKRLSELDLLKQLVPDPANFPPNWTPTDDHWELVQSFYVHEAGNPYDVLRQMVNDRDSDVFSRDLTSMGDIGRLLTNSSSSTPTSRSSSPATSSTSSSSSDSDGGGNGGSIAESIVISDDEDDVEEEDDELMVVRSVRSGRSSGFSPVWNGGMDSGYSSPITSSEKSLSLTFSSSSDNDDDGDGVEIIDLRDSPSPAPSRPRNFTEFLREQPSVWLPPRARAESAGPTSFRSTTRDSSGLFVTPTPGIRLTSSAPASYASEIVDLTDDDEPVEESSNASSASSEASTSSSKRSISDIETSSEASSNKRQRLSLSPTPPSDTS